MKKIRSLITAFAVLLSPFVCQGAAPSDESILKLLEVTNVRALLDQMLPQIDAMMKGAMAELEADAKQ